MRIILEDKQKNKSIREKCNIQDVEKLTKTMKKGWKEHRITQDTN